MQSSQPSVTSKTILVKVCVARVIKVTLEVKMEIYHFGWKDATFNSIQCLIKDEVM